MLMDVRFRNRKPRQYRFVPDQVASGLWISPLPRNRSDVAALLAGEFPEYIRVEAIRLWSGWKKESASPLRIQWLSLEPRE